MQTSTLFKWLLASFSLFSLFGWTDNWMNKPIATWIWQTSEAFAQQEAYLQFAEEHRVNKIYLQIDSDLEHEQYIHFIEQANARNIHVYALGGSPSWTTDPTDFDQFLTWVTNFQEETGLFAGIHADIEPYILDTWQTNAQQALIEQFFERIDTLRLVTNEHALQLEIDIPFWFDEIHYTNKFGQGVVSEWLIDNTDHVTIMAYRNTVQGNDGINQIVKKELQYAKKQQKTITIAVETVQSDEGNEVSFYGHSEKRLTREIRKIERYWKKNDALTNIGVHSLTSWMELTKNADK